MRKRVIAAARSRVARPGSRPLESWGKPVRIKLEEDAFFDGERARYIDGRQRHLHLIPRQAAQQ